MRLQARRARDDLAVSRVLGAGHPLSAASAQRLGQYQLLGCLRSPDCGSLTVFSQKLQARRRG
jgi:hypothetical protein